MSGPIVDFSTSPNSVYSITGSWYANVDGVITNPVTNPTLLTGVSVCDAVRYANPNFPVPSQTIGFQIRPGDEVTFNGVIGDRLRNLPRGFVLNEITVEYTSWFSVVPNYSITLQQGLPPYIYTPDLFSNRGASTSCGHANNKRTRTSVDTEGGFNYLSALYDPYGFSIANYQDSSLGPNYVGLYGKYFQWSVNITTDTEVGGPGSTITIGDSSPGNLDQIMEVMIYWQEYTTVLGQQVLTLTTSPILAEILAQSPTKLIIKIPLTVPPNHILILSGLGDGTQFSGYAPLVILNSNLVNGSGIYGLFSEWRKDTYYDRTFQPNDITNLKIPNPSFKTGFF